MTTTHTYDAVIVGAGGAGLRAAIETSDQVRTAVDLQALPDPLAHRRGAGRRVRRARQHGGGLPGVARVRHGEGRRLPDGPARRRAADERGRRRDLPARALGPAVQPDARRQDRQRRFGGHTRNHGEGAGHARVLRGRPHRPHDPADALPTVRQARRAVLQRVLLPGPAPRRGGRYRGRRRVRAGHRRDPRLPREVRDVRDRRLRPDVPRHVQRARAHRRRPGGRLSARASRSRTWSSSSSIRRACTSWGSC